jgi:hypothetical protein
MNVSPTTTMDAVHAAIIAAMRARFGAQVKTYGAYEEWDPLDDEPTGKLVIPALLLELDADDYDGQSDPTGRLAMTGSWVMHCVLSVKTDNLQQTLRQFSAVVASVILPSDPSGQPRRGNRWGLGGACDLPVRVTGQAGGFSPGLHGRDSRIIRWEQTFYLDEALPL